MPHSSGKKRYTRAELAKIQKEKKSAGNVAGLVKRGLTAAAVGQISPKARKGKAYTAQRARVDAAVTGRRSGSRPPAPPSAKPQTPGQKIYGALTGDNPITRSLGSASAERERQIEEQKRKTRGRR